MPQDAIEWNWLVQKKLLKVGLKNGAFFLTGVVKEILGATLHLISIAD
jgi:hypothetical protein